MANDKAAHKRVISSLRSEIVVLWLIAVAIAGSWMLYDDLNGGGLRETLMFRSIGYAVYPVFYGGIAYLLHWFGRRLTNGSEYLFAENGLIVVGEKSVPIDGLTFETRRNFLGLRELVFYRDGQQVFATKAYLLARPLRQVVEELHYVIQRAR